MGTTAPESDPTVERLLTEARARESAGLMERERAVELLTAAAFLIVAGALATLVDANRTLDPVLAAAMVVAYAAAARVEFQAGAGWAVPTQLVFVPMLFLLPAIQVPLLVGAGFLLAKLPEYASGEIRRERAVIAIGDAWHSLGPAIVLTVAGATSPDLADWPLYVAALASQFALDFGRAVLRGRVALRLRMRDHLRELAAVYAVDAVLAPAGLLVAFACQGQPWAFLLVVPLMGLLAVFAREREARINNALTLSHAYRGTALLLGELLSTSDEYTGSHSRSVVVLAHQVGEALNLNPLELREVEFGALLHDVGKLTVPNAIINKPGPLTDDEMERMRAHTVEGEGMLDRIGGVLAEVGHVVRSHHEHYDGRGYPDGLRGEEIPIAARVVSCCDAFNAMTTDRSYRAAMPVWAAIRELRTHSGTQFDPHVVEALVSIVSGWDTAEDEWDEQEAALVAASPGAKVPAAAGSDRSPRFPRP
jgi:HD-GYP domain-containing protein (c-di-GMP phosphodiesterase class II)